MPHETQLADGRSVDYDICTLSRARQHPVLVNEILCRRTLERTFVKYGHHLYSHRMRTFLLCQSHDGTVRESRNNIDDYIMIQLLWC